MLDVEIGYKNSLDMAPKIKRAAQNIPFLFMSSHIDREIAIRALKSGGKAYLTKPFDIEELIVYISRFTAE